jgi:hypothetical protein
VNRLMLSSADSGRVHFAFVGNGSAVTADDLKAAQAELTAWVAAKFP